MAWIFPTNLGKTYRKRNTISTDIYERESSNPTQYKHPLEKEQFNPLFEKFENHRLREYSETQSTSNIPKVLLSVS